MNQSCTVLVHLCIEVALRRRFNTRAFSLDPLFTSKTRCILLSTLPRCPLWLLMVCCNPFLPGKVHNPMQLPKIVAEGKGQPGGPESKPGGAGVPEMRVGVAGWAFASALCHTIGHLQPWVRKFKDG